MDDHFHRLVMIGSPKVDLQPIEVFTTLDGDQKLNEEYMDLGLLPWWTAQNYRIKFFRYFSVFSMWIDYQLWPNAPSLMHLQSLLWYGALVVAVGYFFRNCIGVTWAAGLAALMYAVDEAHALPVSWLANRNALLSALFGILCLIAYDAWRRKGSKWGSVASPLCLAFGLLSGEMALAVAGYLIAYALFLDPAKWARRFLSLIPQGGLILIYALIYKYYNFGTNGSGYYVNPVGDPLAFAKAVFLRFPLLIMGQFSPIPADIAILLPKELVHIFWLASLGMVFLLAFLFYPLLRKDKLARFWCLGMLFSLLPISAVSPSNRMLFFVGIGAMGLLALFLKGLIEKSDWLPSLRAWKIAAWTISVYFIALNLILAPIAMPINAYSIRIFGDQMISGIRSIPSDEQITQQDLILVNPPDHLLFVTYIGTLKLLEEKPVPKRIRALTDSSASLRITRLDERTINLRVDGGLFANPLGRLFRAEDNPMKEGEEVSIAGMKVRVIGLTEEGDPQEIVVRFSVPLEDPSLRWLKWEKSAYTPFLPPEIGHSIDLPSSRSLFEILK